MATPASQKTTPSPQLVSRPIQDAIASSRKRSHPDMDDVDPALKSFLSTVHYAKLSRELRARLSYATFKASQNASHIPFSTLESQYVHHPRPSPVQQPLSPRHQLSHTHMMPPPPSPKETSLYNSLAARAPIANKRVKHARDQPLRVSFQPRSGRSVHTRTQSVEDINAAATLTSLLLRRPEAGRSEASLSRTSSSTSTTTLLHSQPSSQQSQTTTLYGSQPSADGSITLAPPARIHTPQPEDAQAAELMLFLATSPSPAQPPVTRRPPSRSGQIAKPRVLFANASSEPSDQTKPVPSSISRTNTANAHSSKVTSSNQLLPPPPSPQRTNHKPPEALTPKPAFNFGEFINVSPSPSQIRTTLPRPLVKGEGRKLFADDEDDVQALSHIHAGLSGPPNYRKDRGDAGPKPSFLGPPMEAARV